jgi:hypothetical protein
MKLNVAGCVGTVQLPASLKGRYLVNEGILGPRLVKALASLESNNVSRRLLDNAETVDFKLTNDDGFACAWRARQYVPSKIRPCCGFF